MRASLKDVASTHALRCDAKQSEGRFRAFDSYMASVPSFVLGDLLPDPIVKGTQPLYAEDDASEEGIPVISTMAIQNLRVEVKACRVATLVDYGPNDVRKPRPNDVLLTVDGGTSIGKPVLFNLAGDWAVDSHVAILRPDGLDPALLVYLLASPLGQIQFQRAESGASGQTAVTEDDIRRFVFPVLTGAVAAQAVADVQAASSAAEQLREEARRTEESGWEAFLQDCAPGL